MKVTVTMVGLIALMIIGSNCSTEKPIHYNTYKYWTGSYIRADMCQFDSAQQLEERFQNITHDDEEFLNKTFDHVEAAGYKLFQMTNGNSRFTFVQAYNGPHGSTFFNVYCYQQAGDGLYLRGYVPVNGHWYKWKDAYRHEQDIRIFNDGEYVKVAYRDMIILTISTNWSCQGSLP